LSTDPSDFFEYQYDVSVTQRHRWRAILNAQTALLVLTLIALVAMGWSYFRALKPVSLQVDQRSFVVLSNQTTVAGVLNDAAIVLLPHDIVFPAPSEPVPTNQPILVRHAYPLEIDVDGDRIHQRTQSPTLGEALREAAILLKQGDLLFVDGLVVAPTTPIVRGNENSTIDKVVVQRAVPIQINDDGALTTFYTTAPTLGEAMRQAGLVVYLGDYVSPDLGTPVAPGWQVYIRRSRAATINVDGKTVRTRTRSDTIAGLLAQEGIELKNKDYAIPPATDVVREGANVQVMRVREEFNTESEYIPYETVWQADPSLEIDQRATTQVGAEGVKKRTIRIVYENGREVRRSVDKEWIESPPVSLIYSYGTKIVKRNLTLPDGSSVTYWRKLRILATSYTAATSGKARTHPEYGITYLGWQAGTGVVAVDPRVINLRTKMYVPGYGLAAAGDTGGRIKGRRVDLGYDESNLVLWYKWVDVYLLDPPPPADQIHWIIADTPKERSSH
jgi:resuscitation-promoting factor RpfB